jgi:hypothetical protein
MPLRHAVSHWPGSVHKHRRGAENIASSPCRQHDIAAVPTQGELRLRRRGSAHSDGLGP